MEAQHNHGSIEVTLLFIIEEKLFEVSFCVGIKGISAVTNQKWRFGSMAP